MTEAEQAGLACLAKPNQKLTLLVIGGGMFGCDSRILIVTKGTSGGRPIYAEPRKRKKFYLDTVLRHGAILLNGHFDKGTLPVFEGDVRYQLPGGGSGVSMVLDGLGGRFTDAHGDGGATMLKQLKCYLLLHTLKQDRQFVLRAPRVERGHEEGDIVDEHFELALFDALGPPTPMDPAPEATPQRVNLFTDEMKARLRAARQQEDSGDDTKPSPLYRLFMTDSSATWLVCSMEDDDDTLWGVADIGQGLVEYGTLSLRELETSRSSRFKMPVERDKNWHGTTKTMEEILNLTSLAAGTV